MISKTLEKAINEQINKEMFSAYLYFAMAAYFDNENLEGMAAFMKKQSQEEVGHAMKFYNYVNERGGRVILEALEKPASDFKGPKDIFEQSQKHERFITDSINKIVDLALKENDHATREFLNWFVAEQVEEEATMDKIVSQLKMIGDSGQALIMMDVHLGKRGE